MYKVINILKSRIKKYLPDTLFFPLYSLFKHLSYLFSDHSNEKKTELKLAHFTKTIFKKVTIDDIAFDIQLNPNNGLVDKEIYVKGAWEIDMLREIRKHINRKSICLDIGANIGQHSLYMASIAKEGKIYAFDPIESLALQIKTSIHKNNFKNIEVCHFGLSDKEETKDIYLNNLNMGNTTFKKRAGASSILKANTKIFDTFWGDKGTVDFIKMDVEGYEFFCLLGMKKTLESYHPTMIIEFSPIFYNKMDISSSSIIEFIFDLGYRIYDIDYKHAEVTRKNLPEFLKRVTIQTNILCKIKLS